MDMRHCPVSGLPMVQEVNGLWHNSGCCCYSCKTLGWSNRDLDMAYEWRARLIAEAVESAAVKCDEQAKAWAQHQIAAGVARQCAASIRESVKATSNEETT